MKTVWQGAKKLWHTQPLVLVMLIVCLAACVWFMVRRDYDSIFRTLALPVCSLCGILGYLHYYAGKNAACGAAQTALSEQTDLTMRIVSTVSGEREPVGLELNTYEPGMIRTFYVTFTNRTGGVIQTDTAYRLECRMRGTWYHVEETPGEKETPGALEIPEGTSEKLAIPASPRYPHLAPGYYRMVKTVETARGARTVAAGFSVDDF